MPRGGLLAQLVERFVYTEDVGGSSPSQPTRFPKSRETCETGPVSDIRFGGKLLEGAEG